MNYGFDGKVALVTGASGGIGRATALGFAASGAAVVVSDVNDAGGEETVAQIEELGGDPEAAVNLPPMRKMAAMGRFLQRLRNAGLRPQLMGDFPAAETTNFRKDD